MIKNSCVKRVEGDTFIVVRASYMIICAGNATAAALIHFFESWHNIKISARANFIDPSGKKFKPTLHQWHTTKNLEDALLGIGKKHSIQEAKKLLSDMGIISLHRNPNPEYGFDNTTHFLFHPEVVNELLDRQPKIAHALDEISQSIPPESAEPLDEISRTIPNDTPNDTTKSFSGPAPGDKKKVSKKQEKKPPEDKPPRQFWQPFVDTWHDFYVDKVKGESPSIVGKALSDLAKLYDLLQLRAKKKNKEWGEKYMVEALTFFLNLAWSEDWLQKHFLLKNLIEQFDAIYAREATRMDQAGKNKPKNLTADLSYILERFREGNLDERILTPDIYKHLEEKKLIPDGYREKFTATTPELQKAMAIKAWLEANKNV